MPRFSSRATAHCRRLAVALCAATAAHAAQATLITFDEHPWVIGPNEEYDWSSHPLTDEYDSLGVHIDGAYLQPAGTDPLYPTQYVLGGPTFMSIIFTGTPPTYVSLSFTSPIPELRATVGATGVAGNLGTFDTGGDYWAGPDLGWVHTHYTPHSQASFHSEAGITGLWFSTEASTRITAKIDNLYFGNVPAVPEPQSLALAAAGLLVFGAALLRRRRRQFLPTG